MIGEDYDRLQNFSGSCVMRTIEIGRVPIRNLYLKGLLRRAVPFLAHKIWWTIHRLGCANWKNITYSKSDALSYCAYSYFVREAGSPLPTIDQTLMRAMKTAGGLTNGSGIIG
ncbi:hypothetical protein AVEN_219838-1 [Araneus ventricosus]|uniref:Uncharacterized protein n=1 Tax=Araneus ventricosus TaxID=182803 RepID=A0A4Y2TXC5_ARAVE|nr:hypothetical protein AVEN_219838-1 [Araneus ventricosus]